MIEDVEICNTIFRIDMYFYLNGIHDSETFSMKEQLFAQMMGWA